MKVKHCWKLSTNILNKKNLTAVDALVSYNVKVKTNFPYRDQ